MWSRLWTWFKKWRDVFLTMCFGEKMTDKEIAAFKARPKRKA